VNESLPIGQAVSLGRLSNTSRVTWSARALGRGTLSKNKTYFPIKHGSWNLGSICGRGTEVCEELRSRKVDVCSIQVRWKYKGARFLGVIGRRYKLWWSGNSSSTGGVGILVKDDYVRR